MFTVCFTKWSFLLRSHWNKVTGLYVATRYLPFILLTSNLYSASRSSTYPPNDELTLVPQWTLPQMRAQVYVILGKVSQNNRLTAWFRQRCRVLANVDSGTCMVHPFMHLLAEGYYSPFTGIGIVSVVFSECIYRPFVLCVFLIWFIQVFLSSERMCSGIIIKSYS